ncbi:unnamed protein product [Lactuca saligna]|uniref:Uncharacterized protein n=1 Tax=Lactuca saligna TaxID=75948 RepID=A0AA36E7T7_LACSI|nr:unnamed protein product [Lactuca saligna]
MDWDKAVLWGTFSRYGMVVDVYIAKKLNRLKKRGFLNMLGEKKLLVSSLALRESNGESAIRSDNEEATPVTSLVSTAWRHHSDDQKNYQEDEETHVSNSFPVPEKVAHILNVEDRWREYEATQPIILGRTYPGASSPLGQNRSWDRNSPIKENSRARPTKSLNHNHVPSRSNSPLQS